jgi:glycosyltransferase involved in cell wall biosynthesis
MILSDSKLNKYKQKLGIEKKDKIIIFVGRLHYLKGIDNLIKAVGVLLTDNINIKLLIVGRDDGYKKILTENIPGEFKDKIIFTGPVYRGNIEYLYKLSDCFAITPYHFEETSLASLEALSFGVPVLATIQADIPYLRKYGAGLLVENSISEIRKGLERIIYASHQDQVKMKYGAINLIKNHFMSKSVVRNLVKLVNI